jgi:hypothetical protein
MLRLEKAAAPLPASANSPELYVLAIQGTTNQKKGAWGGREGDDELTNVEKEGAGSPASSNDGRQ